MGDRGTDRDPAARGGLTDAAAVLLLLAVGLWLGLPRYDARIDLADEGMLVHAASRVLAGEVPNRDFVSLQPPLSYYTTALAFRILGTSLHSGRVLGLLLYLLIPLGVYALSRQVAGGAVALAAALPAPFLGMTIWVYAPYPTAQGLVLTLATACLVLHAARTGRTASAFAAGAGTALVILARHDQGFFLVVSVLLFGAALAILRRRAGGGATATALLVRWAAGASILLLPLLVIWGFAGALPGMYRDLVLFPLTRYAETSSLPMPGPGDAAGFGGFVLLALFYLAPPAVGALLLLLAVRLRRGALQDRDVHGLFLAILALGFYYQVVTRSDVYHLVDTLPPLFALGAVWLEELRRSLARRAGGDGGRATVLATGGAAAAGLALWGTVVVATHGTFLLPTVENGVRLGGERGGVELPYEERWVGPTVELLRARVPPDRSMLVLPYRPIFYFLADRRNPTRWNYLWPGDQTPGDLVTFLAEAEADRPAAALLFDQDSMASYAGPVVEWVEREMSAAGTGVDGTVRLYVERR